MGHFERVSTTTNARICTNVTDMAWFITGIVLRSTRINPPDPLVAQVLRCATHRAVNCDDLHPDRYLGGTSCLTGQEGRVTSRQCRMSPPVSTRWACVAAAVDRCARVGEARKKVSTESSGKVIGRQKRAHKHESVSEHCESHRRRGATKYIPGTTARLRGHQCEHLTSIAADLAKRAQSQSIRAYLPICIV